MEVEINPITADTTKRLAKLYPTGDTYPDEDVAEGTISLLDTFFAADFIPPLSKRTHGDTGTSYGAKYVQYLHEVAADQARRHGDDAGRSVREMRATLETPQDQKQQQQQKWEHEARERLLAQAVLVQVQVERRRIGREESAALALAFWASRLPGVLWRAVQQHVAKGDVRADELEVAVELLYLFSSWTDEPSRADRQARAVGPQSVQRVCAAVELLARFARHRGRVDVGRVQRVRLGHKALLLAEVTWRLELGDEAWSLRRVGDSGAGAGGRGLARRGLARDALRQVRVASAKHPALAAEVQGAAARLLALVHPFDGHLTRAAQTDQFGPLRVRGREPRDPEPPLGPELPDGAAEDEGAARRRWAGRAVPRAAREAVAASMAAVRVTRSEREYADWWRRLVGARGMPLSLTLNEAPGRKGANDITINYDAGRRGAGQFEFCGIVEAEDLPGLEAALDGRATVWPADTGPEPDAAAYSALYYALFPLLPELARALVLTIVNWAPAERELPARQFLISMGAPQASEATCMGVVKYPRSAEPDAEPVPVREPSGSAAPLSPLSGSNVKRLGRAPSRGSVGRAAAQGAEPDVPAEVAARLLAQYAQWRAVGSLLMQVLVGLQANHVLQADYFAQLLMNENIIPALFWWLGTANLDLCTRMPPRLRAHTFMAVFAAAEPSCAASKAADRSDVGCDSASNDSGSSEGADEADNDDGDATSTLDAGTAAWAPALRGIYDCMRSLRRLTSHNGLRKGLLYKNKALYFYGRLQRMAHGPVQRIAAELVRDIMPVVTRKQKQLMLETISQVYLHAPPTLGDTFWLADFALDPQIEMHRHVELLRLLHFYHFEAFGLRLPRDPALFPSLASQAVEIQVPPVIPALASATSAAVPPVIIAASVNKPRANKVGAEKSGSVKSQSENSAEPHARNRSARRGSFARRLACRQSGSVAGEYSWLQWDSDLEDTLNDVCSPAVGTSTT